MALPPRAPPRHEMPAALLTDPKMRDMMDPTLVLEGWSSGWG